MNCSVVEVGKDGKGVSGTDVCPVLSIGYSLRTDCDFIEMGIGIVDVGRRPFVGIETGLGVD